MAAATDTVYKGRDFLIKIGDGTSPPTFNTLMGVRSRTITINNEVVDVTDSDNAPWRRLLDDAGLRSLTISASGVAKDDAAGQDLMERALGMIATAGNQTLETCLMQFPNGDILEGLFMIASLERGGEHVAEETFTVTLESGGGLTFTAA